MVILNAGSEMIRVTKTYVCDCCERESVYDDFCTQHQCGNSVLKITGSEGGMSYQGDWGGTNHKIDEFLCFECSRKLRNFYQTMKSDKVMKIQVL